jgi:hypothetical protein
VLFSGTDLLNKKPRTSVLQPLIAFHLGKDLTGDRIEHCDEATSSQVSYGRVQRVLLFLGERTGQVSSPHILPIGFITGAYGGQSVSWTSARSDSHSWTIQESFLCVCFPNWSAQRHMSWLTMACQHQPIWHAWSKSYLNTDRVSLNKKNTEI